MRILLIEPRLKTRTDVVITLHSDHEVFPIECPHLAIQLLQSGKRFDAVLSGLLMLENGALVDYGHQIIFEACAAKIPFVGILTSANHLDHRGAGILSGLLNRQLRLGQTQIVIRRSSRSTKDWRSLLEQFPVRSNVINLGEKLVRLRKT